jgi:DNA polymerase III subunit beta
MKIECLREKLNAAISKAEKITGRNMTLPVLGCILLEAKDSTLTIKSTNLDLGLEIKLPVKIEKEGIVAVPGTILSHFISNLKDEKSIKLEVVDGNLSVSTQNNATIIKSLPYDDFPTIPNVSAERSFTIDSRDFIRGLKAVWYSAAVSSIKPELSSVYIYSDDESIVFVATDSFRLAEKKVKTKKVRDIGSILIPFKNVVEIIKILEESGEEIEVNLSKNQIAFSYNGLYLVSRIIDGAFPDYKQIIPKESKTDVVALKQDLLSSLKISNIFSDKFNQINIKIDPANKHFELTTRNNDVGENVNKLQGAISGEAIDMHFNQKYIVDCFQSIDADSISLSFNGLSKPLIMRGVGDRSFMYLVMPMNK